MDCGNANGMTLEESILDEEFKYYLELAGGLIKRMKLNEDRQICFKYIQKCLKLKSNNIKVKINRNTFFKYFLKMMDRAVGMQFVKISMGDDANDQLDNENISIQWSPDKKSYVAAKVIPGFGTIIYMACTSQPEEWVEHGFRLGDYLEDHIDSFYPDIEPFVLDMETVAQEETAPIPVETP